MHSMVLPYQIVSSLLLMMSSHLACAFDSLVSLSHDFRRWRGRIQPSGGDDILRIRHVAAWRHQPCFFTFMSPFSSDV